MSEKLRFEQVFIDRGTIHGLEKLVGPQAVLVDRAGDQLLSRAAFAADQDG